MTSTEKKALIAEAKKDLAKGVHGLKPHEWVTLLNCYVKDVKAAECAALLRRKPQIVRAIYLNLSLVSLNAVLKDTRDYCHQLAEAR